MRHGALEEATRTHVELGVTDELLAIQCQTKVADLDVARVRARREHACDGALLQHLESVSVALLLAGRAGAATARRILLAVGARRRQLRCLSRSFGRGLGALQALALAIRRDSRLVSLALLRHGAHQQNGPRTPDEMTRGTD